MDCGVSMEKVALLEVRPEAELSMGVNCGVVDELVMPCGDEESEK